MLGRYSYIETFSWWQQAFFNPYKKKKMGEYEWDNQHFTMYKIDGYRRERKKNPPKTRVVEKRKKLENTPEDEKIKKKVC